MGIILTRSFSCSSNFEVGDMCEGYPEKKWKVLLGRILAAEGLQNHGRKFISQLLDKLETRSKHQNDCYHECRWSWEYDIDCSTFAPRARKNHFLGGPFFGYPQLWGNVLQKSGFRADGLKMCWRTDFQLFRAFGHLSCPQRSIYGGILGTWNRGHAPMGQIGHMNREIKST